MLAMPAIWPSGWVNSREYWMNAVASPRLICARGHAQAADDGDPHVAEVGDELHDRHDHAGHELGAEAGLVEFLVPLVEAGQHVGVAAEDADEVVAGEGFLDLAVELAGVLPLGGEELLAAGADDAGGHRRRAAARRVRSGPAARTR